MRTLKKLTIKNFKSIREQTIEPGLLNIFIGGNGVGKSNLIEVFRFLREIVNQNLGGYTAQKGGADKLLYFGRKQSSQMEISLEFGEGDTSNAYDIKIKASMMIASLFGANRFSIMRRINIQSLGTVRFLLLQKNQN